ncbi:hypothetical protein DFH08DRAFT_807062 [Mycena albidolilacea]|uniref:Uncharacterized protein n=1 Tax=Mycena albidolilacea TaxID=1033008 RepID=A0AAD7A526_9AGAR|nr:hypothetical protein DFH08DRAFT_807062 [Mycena albidolilacea]
MSQVVGVTDHEGLTTSQLSDPRAWIKKAEAEMRDGGKHLKAKLKAAEPHEKQKELEIQKLRAQLSALQVLPSNACQRPQVGPLTRRYISPSSPSIDVDGFSPESLIAGPSRLLALFPDLPMDDVKDPQSDFEYQFALQSDINGQCPPSHRIWEQRSLGLQP